MNLSERLDAARAQRDHGFAPDLDEGAYVLRGRVEGQAYDGRELRTGEVMDADRWEEVQASRRGMELPKLYGEEPEEEEPSGPVSEFLDLTSNDLVDLTDHQRLVMPEGDPAGVGDPARDDATQALSDQP
jgi:hypothetical protein